MAALRSSSSTFFLQGEKGLIPQPLLTGQVLQPPNTRVAFAGPAVVGPCLSCSEAPDWMPQQSGWLRRALPADPVTKLSFTQLGGCCPSLLPGHATSSCSCCASGSFQQNCSPAWHSPVPRTSRGTSFPPILVEFHDGFLPPCSCSLSRSP